MDENRWARPTEVSDVQVVFPASVKGLLPPPDEIPKEFKRHAGTWANRMFSEWFYNGLSEAPRFRDGIDPEKAMRHLTACMGSFEPRHEHKEAGVAYLLSLWCEPPVA